MGKTFCDDCGKAMTSLDTLLSHTNRCSVCEEKIATCILCGGQMVWCSCCRMYSSTCCEDYGTCMCS